MNGQLSPEEELLQKRLGLLHANLRLGIEADHEAQVFGQGINYFHPRNLTSSHFVIRTCLHLAGLYERSRKNAAEVEIRRILHLSDLHVEMTEDALVRSIRLLQEIGYDLCVLTGDYRAQAFGAYDAALEGMSQLCASSSRQFTGAGQSTIRSA